MNYLSRARNKLTSARRPLLAREVKITLNKNYRCTKSIIRWHYYCPKYVHQKMERQKERFYRQQFFLQMALDSSLQFFTNGSQILQHGENYIQLWPKP